MPAPSPVTGLRGLQQPRATARATPSPLVPLPAGARGTDSEGALIVLLEGAAKAVVRQRKLTTLSQKDTRGEPELAAVDLGEFIRGDCTVGAERIDVDVGAA